MLKKQGVALVAADLIASAQQASSLATVSHIASGAPRKQGAPLI
jgi:hypothetical protein